MAIGIDGYGYWLIAMVSIKTFIWFLVDIILEVQMSIVPLYSANTTYPESQICPFKIRPNMYKYALDMLIPIDGENE